MQDKLSIRRSPTRATCRWLALVIGIVSIGAACGKASPTAPTPALATGPWTLTISGERSIPEPGATTQLTAVATSANGAWRDVTVEAEWLPSADGVSVVSPGLIRAWLYGQHAVTVTYSDAEGKVSATTDVWVRPNGAYLLTVLVHGTVQPSPGAKVTVSSDAGTFGGETDSLGFCTLPANGATTVAIQRDGVGSATQSLTVTGDQNMHFMM